MKPCTVMWMGHLEKLTLINMPDMYSSSGSSCIHGPLLYYKGHDDPLELYISGMGIKVNFSGLQRPRDLANRRALKESRDIIIP